MNKAISGPCDKIRELLYSLRVKINWLEFWEGQDAEKLLKESTSMIAEMEVQRKEIERLLKKN